MSLPTSGYLTSYIIEQKNIKWMKGHLLKMDVHNKHMEEHNQSIDKSNKHMEERNKRLYEHNQHIDIILLKLAD